MPKTGAFNYEITKKCIKETNKIKKMLQKLDNRKSFYYHSYMFLKRTNNVKKSGNWQTYPTAWKTFYFWIQLPIFNEENNEQGDWMEPAIAALHAVRARRAWSETAARGNTGNTVLSFLNRAGGIALCYPCSRTRQVNGPSVCRQSNAVLLLS